MPLSHCQDLCELELCSLSLNDVELTLASSIISTTFGKLVLTHSTSFRLPVGHTYWTKLDDILIRLVRQLDRGIKFEVEFRDVFVTWCVKLDLREYLPMFVRKGRMRVFDLKKRLIYCSECSGEWR